MRDNLDDSPADSAGEKSQEGFVESGNDSADNGGHAAGMVCGDEQSQPCPLFLYLSEFGDKRVCLGMLGFFASGR